jgi:hypothetical protein
MGAGSGGGWVRLMIKNRPESLVVKVPVVTPAFASF